MDETKCEKNKHLPSFFHEIIIDISKLFTDDDDKQQNIQMTFYATIGMITGLVMYNDQKKKMKEN